jgi:hypothetical protein
MDEWDESIIEFLQLLRKKSVYLSIQHSNSFFYYNKCATLFSVPSIILSIFNGFISVGVSEFIEQQNISLINSSISMLLAILGSVSLYLNLNNLKIKELELSKQYHHLALNISKILFIPVSLRKIEQLDFLNICYDKYVILLQESSLIRVDEAQENVIQKFSPKSILLQPRNPLISPKNIIISN